MKFCLVADDDEAQVVVVECEDFECIRDLAWGYSEESDWVETPCKFHVCRREASANGTQRIVIETWEKGEKV